MRTVKNALIAAASVGLLAVMGASPAEAALINFTWNPSASSPALTGLDSIFTTNVENYAFHGPAIYDGTKYRKLKIADEEDKHLKIPVKNGWIAALKEGAREAKGEEPKKETKTSPFR